MALTAYRFYSGSFKAEWKAPDDAATAIDLGVTEKGIRLNWVPSTVKIQEARLGEIVVAELHAGFREMGVTIESLNFHNSTSVHLMRYAHYTAGIATFAAGNVPDTLSDDEATDAAKYGYLESSIGSSLYQFCGELTLTAITGSFGSNAMVGATSPFKIVVHKCVPLENPSIMFSGRDVIRVPFKFKAFPVFETVDTTKTLLKYATLTESV